MLRRFDYKRISTLNIKLRLTLQSKLTLLSNEKLLMQNNRKNSVELIFMLQLTEMLINIDAKLVKLTRNKRKILAELISMFKLIDIRIVILRKVINNISDDLYKKPLKSIKFLIKKLQTRN